MDNPETSATLGTQYTAGRRKRKQTRWGTRTPAKKPEMHPSTRKGINAIITHYVQSLVLWVDICFLGFMILITFFIPW